MSKHILIIGGMGPQASLHAHKRLLECFVERTPEASNASFPRITHLSINVDDFINDSSTKDSAKAYLVNCLKDVNLGSVDTAFIACNTAHLLYDDVKLMLGSVLLSMVQITTNTIDSRGVGILGTPSTLRANIYSKDLIKPSNESLLRIETIIRRIIQGVNPSILAGDLEAEINELKHKGAEQIILGCTELSIIGSYLDSKCIIDPIELTVAETLDRTYPTVR